MPLVKEDGECTMESVKEDGERTRDDQEAAEL